MIPLSKSFLVTALLIACKASAFDVYFGTSGRESAGIYHAELNQETGELSAASVAAEVPGPGFLVNHPNLPVVYAASGGNQKGFVRAFEVSEPGELKLLNRAEDSRGSAAHISVHPSGKCLMTVQYGAASAAIFPINSDGTVGELGKRIQHEGPGSGVIPRRQKNRHPHWVGFSPDGRFAYVPDLGKDRLDLSPPCLDIFDVNLSISSLS